MKNKKIPMRKCVVTQERFPKKELVRIVRTNEGEIFVDRTGKANGRGAYVQLNKQVIQKAKSKKILERVLECEIPENVFEDLIAYYDEQHQ